MFQTDFPINSVVPATSSDDEDEDEGSDFDPNLIALYDDTSDGNSTSNTDNRSLSSGDDTSSALETEEESDSDFVLAIFTNILES